MYNEPEKWDNQRWLVPKNMLTLIRRGDKWYFATQYDTLIFPVQGPAIIHQAEILSGMIINYHTEEDWIDRHSLQFKWLRFWYRRKKRRDERRRNKGNTK